MSIDLSPLAHTSKLLVEARLRPVQGARFQPTGFPDLGAATYNIPTDGEVISALLVESPQSVANHLERVCWDETRQDLWAPLKGLSYVRVEHKGNYLTSSIEESHRLNSPYILEGGDKSFLERLKKDLEILETGPIDRGQLARILLRYDASCLLHGVFLAKSELAGGRLRVERALSGFIEATGVETVASGGVKKDHVDPSGRAMGGSSKTGFGHVPFHREEFTAKAITAYFNLDLAQLRGYRLGDDVTRMLILVALFKILAFLDGGMRLRTACDLEVLEREATRPVGFKLPELEALQAEIPAAIKACGDALGGVTTVQYKKK